MEKREYLDFELRIQNQEGRYQATVLRSPAGEASYTFDLPFSELELENFVLRLGVTRRGIRRISSPEMGLLREFGSKLFEAVFRRDIRAGFISSQNEAKRRGLGLRLKLRLDAPELLNIPWEYLYDTSMGRFLSLFESTPIVRYVDMREDVKPLRVKPPLSVLLMASSPKDQMPLDIAREQANLQKALSELVDAGMVTIKWMEQATLPALVDCLLRGRYHVFHFIGHGGFDERSQDGLLVLEDDNGGSHFVSGERMAVLLGNHPTLRLAILNACEGARTSRDDPFAGTATTLLRTGGVPAVVAMQFSITDEAAITFSRGFYAALSVSRPVDAAATQARLAVFASGNDAEWGTPVLYMRSPDGRIFDVEALTPTQQAKRQREMEEAQRKREIAERQALEQRTAQLTHLYNQATARVTEQDWAGARELLAQIQEIEPDYRDVPALLDQVRTEQTRVDQLAALLAQGKEHLRQGQSSQAVQVYRRALALAPGHPEATASLAKAERQEQITALYASAQVHLEAGRWSEAVTGFQKVLELDPAHDQAARQLTQAELHRQKAEERAQREKEARQDELARLYALADAAARIEDWPRAIASFQAVLSRQLEYRDASTRLARAKEALAAQEAARQQHLVEQFKQGLTHMQAQRWREAMQAFQAVVEIEPEYGDLDHGTAAHLLAEALAEKERAELPPPPTRPPAAPAAPPQTTRRSRPTDLPR